MTDTLTQVGVGGMLIILVLDRAFGFVSGIIKSRKSSNGTTAGEQSIDFWREIYTRSASQALDLIAVPILKQQLELLKEMQSSNSKHHDEQLKHTFMLDELREGVKTLRLTSHQTLQVVQQLTGRSVL